MSSAVGLKNWIARHNANVRLNDSNPWKFVVETDRSKRTFLNGGGESDRVNFHSSVSFVSTPVRAAGKKRKMADSDAYEQLIQFIKMLRPMAKSNPEMIHTLFSTDKVAQETTKMMSTLGLLDADALANSLAKMVPAKPAEPTFHSNGAPHALPPPPQNPLLSAPFPNGMPPYTIPNAQGTYGAPPPNPGAWYGAPPPPSLSPRPPMPGPSVAPPIPGLQNLSANDANMVMTALAMSQAEVDMLPPHQRAIFMQLRSMMPAR